jgi:uncharacterized protein YyaL (SSP411 family)
MIGAYLKLYAATGDPRWAAVARRTGETLLASRLRPEGWILQVSKSDPSEKDERKRAALSDGRMYLKAQAHMGRALLALHAATGETKWLDAATGIAKAMRTRLEDPSGGGFFTTEARPTDALAPRRKAFYDNVIAARFFLDLSEIAKDAALEQSAERTLSAMAASAGEEDTTSVSHFTLAVERIVTGPLGITLTGDGADPKAKALRDAAVRLRQPRALVHADVAKTYPQGRTAAYVCTRDQCSSPIVDPAALGAVVARMAAIRAGEGCRAAP